jgi:hypothetical protein
MSEHKNFVQLISYIEYIAEYQVEPERSYTLQYIMRSTIGTKSSEISLGIYQGIAVNVPNFGLN